FLTVNPAGPRYYTLDTSLQFAPYGDSAQLLTDGVNVVYILTTGTGFEIGTVSAFDGISESQVLATLFDPATQPGWPSIGPGYLTVFGTAVGDGKVIVLTYSSISSDTGPITANVIDLASGELSSSIVLSNSATPSNFPGARPFLGYAAGWLW